MIELARQKGKHVTVQISVNGKLLFVGTGQSGEWGSRVEVVWCNRPIADGGLLDLIQMGVTA